MRFFPSVACIRSLASVAKATIPKSVRASRLYQSARHLIVPHNTDYDRNYFTRDIEIPAAESAGMMAVSIMEYFAPKSVIDVGCGTGALLSALRDRGCDVVGLEYADAGIDFCTTRGLPVRKFNIERDSFDDARKFDIAISFEVAEHLPVWCASRYADLLCQLAPIIAMSAATPDQPGTGHINMQPRSYWMNKFSERGYRYNEATTATLSLRWRESGLPNFYYKNLMIFEA